MGAEKIGLNKVRGDVMYTNIIFWQKNKSKRQTENQKYIKAQYYICYTYVLRNMAAWLVYFCPLKTSNRTTYILLSNGALFYSNKKSKKCSFSRQNCCFYKILNSEQSL